MADLIIRDPYGNTFPVDATARAYWEHREGYTILPEPQPEPEHAQPTPEADPPKTSKKAASRPASNVKEQDVV